MKEKIKLTAEQQKNAVYGDSSEFDLITDEITGTWRHGNDVEAIVQRVSDGKFFKICYRQPTNDMDRYEDCNYDGEFEEVLKTEKVITVYC